MIDKKIGAIIVAFNNVYDTLATLGSLLNSDYKNIDILIVDNGSDDRYSKRLYDEVKRKSAHTEFLHIEEDRGYGSACNKGAQHLIKKGSDILLFLNNDLILDRKCISNLMRNLEEEKVALAGPKAYLRFSNIIYSAGGFFNKRFLTVYNRAGGQIDTGQYDRRQEVEFINGCAFMMLAKPFMEVGGFDEKFLYYSDEADLCYRLIKNGYKIVYEPQAIVYHWAGTTLGTESKKSLYYMVRSKLHFVSKHSGNNKMVIFYNLNYIFFHFLIKLTYHRCGQIITRCIAVLRGIKDFMIGRTGKGPYG